MATIAILSEAGERMSVEIDRLVAKVEHHRVRADGHHLAVRQRDEFLSDVNSAYTRADDDAAKLEVKVMQLQKKLATQDAALKSKRSRVELYTDRAIAWDEVERLKKKLRVRDEELMPLQGQLGEYVSVSWLLEVDIGPVM
jgi:chromosome segregation ATPase